MVHPATEPLALPANTTALLIGPGLASSEVSRRYKDELVERWKYSAFPVIADASALDFLPPGPIFASALRVITPHPGEAARMLKSTTVAVQADRLRAVRQLSERFANSWVVLKGHQTLIGRSEGPVFVNSSGNSFLAQGGSGDLLAGFITGFLAQPLLHERAGEIIRYAVWRHGLAADELSARHSRWTIDQLAEIL
jgi:hydroxyethylthiazole kinase-like uncharacterized protein yjeF